MNSGRSGSGEPSGLRPFGAEPATQSQAEPLVPNAETRANLSLRMESLALIERGEGNIVAAELLREGAEALDDADRFNARLTAAYLNSSDREAQLRAAVIALADGAERIGEKYHIVQPLLAIYRKHGETIAAARTASGIEAPEGRRDNAVGSTEGESPAPEGGDAQPQHPIEHSGNTGEGK